MATENLEVSVYRIMVGSRRIVMDSGKATGDTTLALRALPHAVRETYLGSQASRRVFTVK